jgi:hypothetical protein
MSCNGRTYSKSHLGTGIELGGTLLASSQQIPGASTEDRKRCREGKGHKHSVSNYHQIILHYREKGIA